MKQMLQAGYWKKRIRKPLRLAFHALERRNFFSSCASIPWARCGLTLAPLGAVILLCWVMVGWRENLHRSAIQAASAEAALPEEKPHALLSGGAMAAFERLRIMHSSVKVPE